MSAKLFFSAAVKFLLGVLLVGVLIFLPAGTFSYFNGWLLMGILFLPMLAAGIVMMVKSPKLLAGRLDAKEKQKEQGAVVKICGLMFICGFVLAGLGVRFSWFMLPVGASVAAAVVFLGAYLLYAEVMRENVYLSRTVKVEEGQRVVDTGLYGIVRHPMYAVTLVLFLAIPLVLGSVFALPVFLIYPFVIAKRIKHEEELLERELEGYSEYKNKVKYRLIPFIW